MKHEPYTYSDFNEEGKLVKITELTLEELQQAYCKTVDRIEELEELLEKSVALIDNWRHS